MGVVYEAEDTTLNRRVALKVISPHLAEDDEFRARFTREAQAQASLDSAHVVHVYAHGVGDGRLYIAAQLIPDGDLGQMIAGVRRPAGPGRARRDGAGGRRSRGRPRGRTDPPRHQAGERPAPSPRRTASRRTSATSASPARSASTRRRAGTGTIGTPSYMAPELHTGGKARVESDIYSLGCLLWATVTGRAPYTGTSEYQIVSAHVEQPVPQLPEDGPLATRGQPRSCARRWPRTPPSGTRRPPTCATTCARARTLPDGATPVDRPRPRRRPEPQARRRPGAASSSWSP